MALSGEGAVCIWNDITPEGEAEFYAWHVEEHMPERVGIPGFLRGRRYAAVDTATAPRFYTLYETTSPQVMVGQDYLNRLNAPTDWTRRATQGFRNTFRALTRVSLSLGPGPGGVMGTLRLTLEPRQREALLDGLLGGALARVVRLPLITGAHVCVTDMQASAGRTEESRGRSDIQEPPNTVVMVEGCQPGPVRDAIGRLTGDAAFDGMPKPLVGLYGLEFTRLKTAAAAG